MFQPFTTIHHSQPCAGSTAGTLILGTPTSGRLPPVPPIRHPAGLSQERRGHKRLPHSVLEENLGLGCREAGSNRDLFRLVFASLQSFLFLKGSWESYSARIAFHPDLRKEVAVAVAMADQFGLGPRPVRLCPIRHHKRGFAVVGALNQQHRRTQCQFADPILARERHGHCREGKGNIRRARPLALAPLGPPATPAPTSRLFCIGSSSWNPPVCQAQRPSSSPSRRPSSPELRCNPRALSRIPGRMTTQSRYTASQLLMNSESPKDSGLSTPECSLSQRTATAGVTAFRREARKRHLQRCAIFSQKRFEYVPMDNALRLYAFIEKTNLGLPQKSDHFRAQKRHSVYPCSSFER